MWWHHPVIQAVMFGTAALAALTSWHRHRSVLRAALAAVVGYVLWPLLALVLVFGVLGAALGQQQRT